MHDDLLERRLQTALRDEADRLGFTITAAELERRAVLRARAPGSRRMIVLLAAAVGIGALGVAALGGSLVDRPIDSTPGPTAAVSSTDAPPAVLASLDELLAGVDPQRVVLAHAHDLLDTHENSDIEIPQQQVTLGEVAAGRSYRIWVACDSDGPLVLDIRVPFSRGPRDGPTVACDRDVHLIDLAPVQSQSISFTAAWTTSWRVVVARTEPPTEPQGPDRQPPILAVPEGQEPLIDMQAETEANALESPDPRGHTRQGLPAVPARWAYHIALWCQGGDTVRYIHGGDVEGTFLAGTTIDVPCDGAVHVTELGFPEINGTEAFLAAAPGTRWSVLVSAESPPVETVWELPGWALTMGFGPDLAFETSGSSLSGGGVEGGGPLMVLLDCAAPAGQIEVRVDVRGTLGDDVDPDRFLADCAPEGIQTSRSFITEGDGFIAEYTAPSGAWTALTVLVPETAPAP